MQWGEIWTQGAQDGVVSGLVCALIVAVVASVLAWSRNWRMRNPWAWLISNMKERFELNFGGYLSSMALFIAGTVIFAADLSPGETNFKIAASVFWVSVALWGWFTFFVASTEAGSTKSLFYRHKATPSVVSSVASAKAAAGHAPSPVAGPTSVSASHLKHAIMQGQAGDLDRYFDLKSTEFNIIKALYQTQGQPGLTVETICTMRELTVADAIDALIDLGAAGVVEQRDDKSEPTYRLTEAGLTLFRRWMRTPNRF